MLKARPNHTIVYRVEDRTGQGPYTSSYTTEIGECIADLCLPSNKGSTIHPMPWDDTGLCNQLEEKGFGRFSYHQDYKPLFGFSSLTQCFEWFAPNGIHYSKSDRLEAQEKLGAHIVALEVENTYKEGKVPTVVHGSSQSVFLPEYRTYPSKAYFSFVTGERLTQEEISRILTLPTETL